MFALVVLYAIVSTTPVHASRGGAYQEPILFPQQDQACPQPQLSCPTSTPSHVDACCLNTPGGHFLLTQFWDSSPSLGPADSWTLHGLWPDLCDGGYDQSCDASRALNDIRSAILSASPSASDLLDFMSQYWLSLNGDNNHLWAHEWSKHGTCISTLEPACYGDGDDSDSESDSSSSSRQDDNSTTSHKDVLDYFTRAVELFRARNTYDALAASNIVPTYERAYDLAELQAAISPLQGADVTFRCDRQELREIWYHFRVRGPLRDAPPFSSSSSSSTTADTDNSIFVPTDPADGAKSNCPQTGIRYVPKQSNQQPPPSSSTWASTPTSRNNIPSSTSTSSPIPFSGRGHLLVRPISPLPSDMNKDTSASAPAGVNGCLIRSGEWYLASGTSCANYIAKIDPKPSSDLLGDGDDSSSDSDSDSDFFTLSSLYAPCAVIPPVFPRGGGLFMCERNLGIQSLFSSECAADDDDDDDECKSGLYKLRHLDQTTFFADKVPDKWEKVGIYVDDKGGERTVQVEILWQAL